ncbi:hypothetical protein QCA50_001623 [Cerrena zonata]|uniref:Rhodanese domain-containing protein n=1 Tax=Cerrena zonata TaxID=2478898 RepID=A0AAW0GW93_9APHY
MLRVACRRAFVPAVSSARASHARVIAPISFRQSIRLNSTQAPSKPSQKEKIHEAGNKLSSDWNAPVLSYEALKTKTEQPSPYAYVIDVREPAEVLQGSIPSSVNLPLSTLADDLHLGREQFKEKFGFEKPRHHQELVFYCRSGVRSTTACDVAKRNGYKNILNYKGSWLDWIEREGKGQTSPPAQS